MLKYDLGDMKGPDGSVLRYEVEKRALECTMAISHTIQNTPIYEELAGQIKSPRLPLYFQFVVREEIYPIVKEACVIEWYKRNGRAIAEKNEKVRVPECGAFLFLKEKWPFDNVPLVFVNPFLFCLTHRPIAYLSDRVKNCVKEFLYRMDELLDRIFKKNNAHYTTEQTATIACHYVEGVDYTRRNDLSWFPESGISPERVLIYFDKKHLTSKGANIGVRIRRKVLEDVSAQGFKWVVLTRDIIEGQGLHYWKPMAPAKDIFVKKGTAKSKMERWVAGVANKIIKEVHYWRSFHKCFNIKIHHVSEEGNKWNIAQAIAFDIDRSGFLVGKHRSALSIWLVGDHPKHIFFTWSDRISELSRYDRIEYFVVTGYPYDILKMREHAAISEFCQRVRSNGVTFIAALFDNVHWTDSHFSTKYMSSFYQAILEWVLNDPAIALIIKSKKAYVIRNLPSIHALLDKTLQTGRCLRVEDESRVFPSDASHFADIAIGCGISSAISEAAIRGHRGIQYDMTHLKKHEFYKWGYEQIIFDDLNRMMAALKRYAAGSAGDIGLGDWSKHISKLDTFRDGKGSVRIGEYIRWLLESFDNGADRDGAIEYVNKRYAEKWGKDKIIKSEHENETA